MYHNSDEVCFPEYTGREVYEFISKQTNDPIVEWKTCRVSGSKFAIFQSDLDFLDKISPTFGAKVFQIPTPTLCPEERQRRRLMFRNERKLYRRKCDATGENIISVYSPDKPYKVYKQDFWRSDNWDAMKYGKAFDFDRIFTEQFLTLMLEVPRIANLIKTSQNCEYNVIMGNSKDCYMCSAVFQSEACIHSGWCIESKYCVDCNSLLRCELGYQCVDGYKLHDVYFSENCKECNKGFFLYDCIGCNHCFVCSGLRNKEYCFQNQQLTKEEYHDMIQQFFPLQHTQIKKFIDIQQQLKANQVKKYDTSKNSPGSYGSYLIDSKNCTLCFNLADGTNVKYGFDSSVGVRDCMDISMIGDQVDLMYEAHAAGYHGHGSSFVNLCRENTSLLYCDHCMFCSNCFGCISLRNKSYCILNKQYSKEEYEKLVPQIIEKMQADGERGEFFDPSLSSFGYNETVAQEYFPLTRDEASSRGYKRQDNNYDPKIPDGIKVIGGEDIPSDISQVADDILKKILVCEVSGRPYRIIKQELDFYRKHNLPLPRKHPDIRHEERLKQRPSRELHLRKCDKCGKEMVSVHQKAPLLGGDGLGGGQTQEQKVYCEGCYQSEVYG